MTAMPVDVAVGLIDGAGERRSGKRHSSVLLIGRLCGKNEACVVHDISRHGLMARFAVPPRVGETLCIELRGLPPLTGIVRWVNGRKAGLQFDEAQPFEEVFRLKRSDGTIARPPRFELTVPARLWFGEERFDAAVIDISAGGIKLESDHVLAPGQTGQVMLPETGTAAFGTVCWTQGERLGFRFVSALPLDTLAVILNRPR